MLAVLQADVTNVSDSPRHIVRDYADGTIGDHWTDGVPPIIWKARVLVRGLILALTAVVHRPSASRPRISSSRPASSWPRWWSIYRSTVTMVAPGGALFAAALAVASVPWGFLSVGFRISYPYDLPAHLFLCRRTGGDTRATIRPARVAAVRSARSTRRRPCSCFQRTSWPNGAADRAEHGGEGRVLITRALILAAAFAMAYEVPRAAAAVRRSRCWSPSMRRAGTRLIPGSGPTSVTF